MHSRARTAKVQIYFQSATLSTKKLDFEGGRERSRGGAVGELWGGVREIRETHKALGNP